MLKKLLLGIVVSMLLTPAAYGGNDHEAHHKRLREFAGPPGPYCHHERFPKDYFLIPKNLPHLMGPLLFCSNKADIGLSGEQKDALIKLKTKYFPGIKEKALAVKKLELELAERILVKKEDPNALKDLLEQIAGLRTELSVIHLNCIKDVQSILSKEQYEAVLKMLKDKAKSNEHHHH